MKYQNRININSFSPFSFKNYLHLFLIFAAVTASGPFVLKEFSWHPGKALVISILVIFLFIFVIRRNVVFSKFSIYVSCLIFVQILYFITKNMYHFQYSYFNNILLFVGLIITIIFIISFMGFEKFIYSNIIFFSLLSLICFLGFLLALFGKIEPQYFFDRGNGETVYHFYLTTANTLFPVGGGYIIKMAGIFTEGGTMGFYIIHILLLNKLSYNNKNYERILLVAGLPTFSIAFYTSVFIYYILFYFNRSSLKFFLFSSGLLVLSFYLIGYYNDTNSTASYINAFIIERIGPYGTGVTGGGNRAELLSGSLPYIAERPLLGYGYKYLMTTLGTAYQASIAGQVVMHGFLGIVFVFLHFIILAIRSFQLAILNGNFLFLKASWLMALNYIQRPYISSYYIYLIIISMLYLLTHYYEKKYRLIKMPAIN